MSTNATSPIRKQEVRNVLSGVAKNEIERGLDFTNHYLQQMFQNAKLLGARDELIGQCFPTCGP